MIKIRFDKETGLLTGWENDFNKFLDLPLRESDNIALLDIPIPTSDDYENYYYIDNELLHVPKIKRRDLEAEIDEIKEILTAIEARLMVDKL